MVSKIIQYPYKSTPGITVSYQYSEFQGFDFLKSYKAFRVRTLKSLKTDKNKVKSLISDFLENKNFGKFNVDSLNESLSERDLSLNDLIHLFVIQYGEKPKNNAAVYKLLSRLIKRYEVSRKICSINNGLYIYVLFAANLAIFYKNSNNLKFLNTLLKLNDMLCSVHKNISQKYIPLLYFSINSEFEEVNKLFIKKGVEL